MKLSFGAGEPIRDFIYGAAAPWPVLSAGMSLTLVHPRSLPAHADPYSWRAVVVDGGIPNGTDGTTFTSGDFASSAFRNDRGSITRSVTGGIIYEIEMNLLADDLDVRLMVSDDLQNWQPVGGELSIVSRTPMTDGFARPQFQGALVDTDRRFLRYEAEKK